MNPILKPDCLSEGIGLRPAQAADKAFLFEVYVSTRIGDVALFNWDESQKLAFLDMQFNAQHQYYTAQFPDAHWDVLELNGEGIGRLYTNRHAHEIHIIDITLLPEFRRQGIGSNLLQSLMDEAASTNQYVLAHVAQFNPAMHLYQRLGFRSVSDDGMYTRMEWHP
ncbi:GNAT family N-acetyltransferase [Sulfurirhabdus autotrophica]|uniref:GNAT family N-acetyltransferase n=1 Tax=Sulfurirhabdus autotrophica TaxID=1706046 RepID=UPI001CB8F628|nr:GNAT family N-acetyltransferase [Sulfurirhabdus autotrophica]